MTPIDAARYHSDMMQLSRSATLVLLLTAATVQQIRYVAHSTLPAQDAVDTVSVAQRMQLEGVPATVRAEPVPPLFPALVATTHTILSRTGIIEAHNWIRPPQVVAALALILAVIPIFLTTEHLAGRGPAVIATIFFITLPALARLGADGLGDAVHLGLVAWSAWFLVLASKRVYPVGPDGGDKPRRSPRTFVVWMAAGLCIAAALLVRAEAVVIPLALLLLAVPKPEFRRPGFFLAASLCLVPYVGVGVTSSEELVARLRGGAAPTEDRPFNAPASYAARPPVAVDESLTFGHKDRSRSSRFHGLAATLQEFADELLMAGGYLVPFLAVAGFYSRRRAGSYYDAFIVLALGLQLAITLAVAGRNGYLSTRHFAVPMTLLLPYAGLALVGVRNLSSQVAVVGGFAIVSLIVTAQPLHESQLAHRQAAEWLQAAAGPGDVLDQQGYTALTSGRTTYRFDAAEQALADPRLAYVVVERADLEANSPRGQSLRTVLGDADRAAIRFAAPRQKTARDVLVFARTSTNLALREIDDAR